MNNKVDNNTNFSAEVVSTDSVVVVSFIYIQLKEINMM